MLERLADIERRYEELSDIINNTEIIADNERWRKLMKEHSDITPIVEKYREYKKIKEELAEAEEMLNDSSIDDDFKALVKEEFSENKKKIVDTEEELKILMLPKDPNDDKNVIVEIRGGAGGDEANIFAGDLYRMYSRYAERRRWKTEIMSVNESEAGGFREISFMISGHQSKLYAFKISTTSSFSPALSISLNPRSNSIYLVFLNISFITFSRSFITTPSLYSRAASSAFSKLPYSEIPKFL